MRTTNFIKKIIPFVVLVLFGIIFVSCTEAESVQSVVESIVGTQYSYISASNLTLPTFDNTTISLNSYKGKLIYLQVWRSGCHYCQQEAPLISELYHKYIKSDDNIEMIGISIDKVVDEAQDFVKTYNLPYPTMLTKGNDATLNDSGYGISGTPSAFIISPTGIVIGKSKGYFEFKPSQLYSKLKKIYKLSKK